MRNNACNELYTAYSDEVVRVFDVLVPEARLAVLRKMKRALDEAKYPACFSAGIIHIFYKDGGVESINVAKAMASAKRAEKNRLSDKIRGI